MALSEASKRRKAQWASRVGEVFSLNPRNGSGENAVWLPREEEESAISDLLALPGVNICIDGSTGTGKTSLALTELSFAGINYALVQVTESMDWKDFCRRLVINPSAQLRTSSSEIKGGMKGLLPHFEFRVSLAPEATEAELLEIQERVAANWSEHDVCQRLIESNAAIMIDDFERARPELVTRISDMCKLVTQSYASPSTKLVIVGTDDIYMKLCRANKSLEARIEEVSIGTLASPSESWQFLQLGFQALGLFHPGNDPILRNREQIKECMLAVYEAGDGLLKSLIQLGRYISLEGFARSRVSPSDIRSAALDKAKRDFKALQREIPKICALVEKYTEVRLVLSHMYATGIGRIHFLSDISADLWPTIVEHQVEEALAVLAEEKFIIRTGENGDVIFVTNPRLAHLLGVVVANPEKYGQRKERYAPFGQLRLPFSARAELPPARLGVSSQKEHTEG